MTHVGKFVRDWRKKNEYSQGDLARMTKYNSAQVISNIERGVYPGSPYTFCKRLKRFLSQADRKRLTDVLAMDVLNTAAKRIE